MKAVEYQDPGPHIVIDDFLEEKDLKGILRQVIALRNRANEGLVFSKTSSGAPIFLKTDLKSNKVVRLNDSPILDTLSRRLHSTAVQARINLAANPLFRLTRWAEPVSCQLSIYGDKAYYDYHIDAPPQDKDRIFTEQTVLFLFCKEPKKFSGGHLVLKHGLRQKKLPFKNNRLVLFASNLVHRVSQIKLKDDQFENCRYSLQFWPKIFLNKRLKTQEKFVPVRRPSFALMESSRKSLEQFLYFLHTNQSSELSMHLQGTEVAFDQIESNLRYLAKALFSVECKKPMFFWDREGQKFQGRMSVVIRLKGKSHWVLSYIFIRKSLKDSVPNCFIGIENRTGRDIKFVQYPITLQENETASLRIAEKLLAQAKEP
jgi:predicted 2-oxoglutarate/Fe(II)-dependent dioxygenase YbiX